MTGTLGSLDVLLGAQDAIADRLASLPCEAGMTACYDRLNFASHLWCPACRAHHHAAKAAYALAELARQERARAQDDRVLAAFRLGALSPD